MIHEITGAADAGDGAHSQALELLRHYGLPAFNLVGVRPDSQTELSIAGQPLLVTDAWGKGKTAVFTGFTPPASDASSLPLDEYFMGEPQARAYFALFADMLARVMPGAPQVAPGLLAAREKPLFQMLKENPQTELEATIDEAQKDSRCRIRVTNKGGFAHLVHMRFAWPETGVKPYLAELSDNDFELLPNETREIEVSWRTSTADHKVGGTLIVNAANAPEVRVAF